MKTTIKNKFSLSLPFILFFFFLLPNQHSFASDFSKSSLHTENPLPSVFHYIFSSVSKTPVLEGKIIVIDPGHGGRFSGAEENGLSEEELNLDVSLKLKKILLDKGANVYLTRESDVACDTSSYENDLNCRPLLASKANADLFLSIHANSFSNPNASGLETFYLNEKDSMLSSYLLDSLSQSTELKKRFSKKVSYQVLRASTVPSVLIEMGYLTSPNDSFLLKQNEFRERVAEGISDGLVKYYGN